MPVGLRQSFNSVRMYTKLLLVHINNIKKLYDIVFQETPTTYVLKRIIKHITIDYDKFFFFF